MALSERDYIPLEKIAEAYGVQDRTAANMGFKNGYMLITPSRTNISKSDSLFFQYNPETIEYSGEAKYDEEDEKGVIPILEYVSNKLEQFPITFLLADDLDSVQDNMLKQNNDKIDIVRYISIIQGLVRPIPGIKSPPQVKVVLGKISMQGFVKKYSIKVLKSHPNLSPKLVEVSLDMEGEVCLGT